MADEYNEDQQKRVSWGSLVPELYSRSDPDIPVVSTQSRRGLRKLGIEPATGFDACSDQLLAFRETYRDIAGHVTASSNNPIPIFEEIDQLFTLITTLDSQDIRTEDAGKRRDLYTALRGYPGAHATDSGPIEINVAAARPAIDRPWLACRHTGRRLKLLPSPP